MAKSIETYQNHPKTTTLTTYQAGIMQAAVNRTLQRYSDEVLRPYGITKMQWLIIGTIRDAGSMRLTDLAETLDTTLAYLTTTVNLLESKRILQRIANTEDSRSKLVVVHSGFEPRCDEIEARLRAQLRELIFKNIERDEFSVYLKVLEKLSNLKP